MIKRVDLRNFKCLRRTEVDLRPLTVLAGLNGSGKSTFVQSMMGLKCCLERIENGVCKLDLGKRGLAVGTAQRLYNQFNTSSESAISVAVQVLADTGTVSSLSLKAKYDSSLANDDCLTFEPDRDLASQEAARVKEAFSNVRRLSAVRIGPRLLHETSESAVRARDMGVSGEYAAAYLLAHGQDEVAAPLRRPVPGTGVVPTSLSDQVSLWMQVVSPRVRVRVSPDGTNSNVQLSYVYGSDEWAHEFYPENVGVGLSIVFPVLVMVLSAQRGDCLIIENPESDLHPQGQAELALLLALAAKCGIQVIVETHSDHIINGIRVAVKRGHLGSDNVAFWFFRSQCEEFAKGSPPEIFSTVEMAEVDAGGVLSRDIPDFLDDWGKQIDQLIGLEDVTGDDGDDDAVSYWP